MLIHVRPNLSVEIRGDISNLEAPSSRFSDCETEALRQKLVPGLQRNDWNFLSLIYRPKSADLEMSQGRTLWFSYSENKPVVVAAIRIKEISFDAHYMLQYWIQTTTSSDHGNDVTQRW